MRAYVQQLLEGDASYLSFNQLAHWFSERGYEVIRFDYSQLDEGFLDRGLLKHPDEAIVAGSVRTVREALVRAGRHTEHVPDLPACLEPWIGRKFWVTTLGEIRSLCEVGSSRLPLHVKPAEHPKLFTGKLVQHRTDLARLGDVDDAEPVLVQEPLDLRSEWRAYVLRNRIVHVARYAGDPLSFPDPIRLDAALSAPTRCLWHGLGNHSQGRNCVDRGQRCRCTGELRSRRETAHGNDRGPLAATDESAGQWYRKQSMTSAFMTIDPRLHNQVEQHPYPLLFATISGSHLYGFPSADSDFDLRGAHVLPLREVIGLRMGPETLEKSGMHDGLEIDLVTHDAGKFFGLLLKKNGYVMEQVLSPLIVRTTSEHEELTEIARQCVTRHHAHHYLGFAHTQWKLFEKESPPRVKPLLYVYRVLLTGIHLMRTGSIEANLVRLNDEFRLPYVPDLIQRKTHGAEQGLLPAADFGFHACEFERLRNQLQVDFEESNLPEMPAGATALNDLLIRIRLHSTSM